MPNDDFADNRICAAVDSAFETEQVPWLKRLVEQPSHTAARADVEQAAAIIDELAQQTGLRRTVFPDPRGTFADHRVFSTPATDDDGVAMALVGHCDTVYPRSQGFLEFRRDTIDSESSGDHIYGPGVLDMKSGLSVILFALRAISIVDPDKFAKLPIRFICNTDEEVGSPSSHALFDQLAPRTSAALVFEGGRDEDRIITARKGTGGFRVTAIGHESHAGNDHKSGINAIHVLALVIPRIAALTDYDRGTTVNIGIVEGGTAKNTVPGRASCVIDVRVTTMAEAKHVQTALQAIVDRPFEDLADVPPRFASAKVELDGDMRRLPMEATEASQELRRAYERFAAPQGLGIGEAPLQGGGSDGNLLAAHGVPTIDGLGPYGKFFHSPREWSSLESLRQRTKALACFLAATP